MIQDLVLLHVYILKAKTKFPVYLYLLIFCKNQFLNFPFLTILQESR